MSIVAIIFLLLVVYQLKHFIADYPLQTEYMLGKFKPGWDFLGPLLTHVSVHFSLTVIISTAVLVYFENPAPVGFALLLGLGDASIHFIMDRIKAGPKYMGRWKPLNAVQYLEHKKTLAAKPGDRYYETMFNQWCDYEAEVLAMDKNHALRDLRGNMLFWVSIGLDQAIHHLTDYAAIYAVLKIAGAL